MTREFPFLPDLPKANLDDRSFDDLVQECLLRIPRYCPEWTNYNPGDPGITLIELFAWMTDQMLMRFNQVPRRNYVAFLELLGVRLQPPTAAQVELSFYLSKAQPQTSTIPAYTEVATVRTETEPAVVFTTDRDLAIAPLQIRGLLTAARAEELEKNQRFVDRVPIVEGVPQFNQLSNGNELVLFTNRTVDNCFYVVLAPLPADDEPDPASTSGSNEGSQAEPNAGQVIALNVRGSIAQTTGIDPTRPPLRWEVWTQEGWQQGILRQREDDKTRGFSFQGQQGANSTQAGQGEGDIILHLPQTLPEVDFNTNHRGFWIRCTYIQPEDGSEGYSYSPTITHLGVRSIGGTVSAIECVRIQSELLGISTGKPGKSFQLQGRPVLARQPNEHIWLRLPSGEIEDWQEVTDFGDSRAGDRHYLIDSQAGMVQFGPLVREPSQIKEMTQRRSQLQPWGKQTPNIEALLPVVDDHSPDEKRQYGRVPPLGAEIYMSAYRIGGGSGGNVRADTLSVPKVALPYVQRVVNHRPATGGQEAESLDEAALRVPQILRTANTAVIPEDFENIARRAHPSVYRAHCPAYSGTPGVVKVLIVPRPDRLSQAQVAHPQVPFPDNLAPDRVFALGAIAPQVQEKIQRDLDHHRTLGLQVRLESPTYVGVQVEAEVLLQPLDDTQEARQRILPRLTAALYRFLNPITGGFTGTGWALGQILHRSDIVALLQGVPQVRYVGEVKLFGIRKCGSIWQRSGLADVMVDPGELGLLCSWNDLSLESGHVIHFLSRDRQ